MIQRQLNRLVAFGVFAVALATYTLTLSPTVVFWDVGEFCAAAFSLQVPHPPGAPLFLLLARLFAMIPYAADTAVRMHWISALGSATSIMFLYLITVRFIVMFRGYPSTTADKLVVYGGGAVGALTMAFCKTYWFNAVEAEVYGLSMFFMSGMLWLGMRWYERADRPRSDVYLLLIAYMVGLAVGVHLLSILTVFIIMLLIYFRWYEFSVSSFVKFGVVALLAFGMIYPIVVKEIPSMLDGEIGGVKSEVFSFLPYLAVFGALYGVYETSRRRQRKLHIGLLAFLFIVLGYSTYFMVYIRANAQPPMNENDPSTTSRLVSYLNREQYGSAPFFNRRWDPDPEKQAVHRRYSSDFDYFWNYQLNHMYLRYFGWNFIGVEGDEKEAPVTWRQFWGLPLLLGMFGAYHHWRRDPKMAFVNTGLFLVMGLALVLYFNMQEPQPRERDYFYVGSFLAFSIWVGIGVVGLADLIREELKKSTMTVPVAGATVGLALLLVPVNMARVNWHEADRTGNYIAWDYSYNLLQSVEQDAILFTNGDNDTFPLWYLQDVEGIRRDVRIVNLSLLNTNWYIRQLKHEQPYGSKKVPISTSDGDIDRIGPIPWQERQMELPIGKDVVQRFAQEGIVYGPVDSGITQRGVLRFKMPATLSYSNVQAIRTQDILVYDIVRTSAWDRPIYFAMTVSDDGKIGLRDYMQLRGLAFKLVPRQAPFWQNLDTAAIEAHLFTDVTTPSMTPKPGFRWRGLQNPRTYYDEDSRRLIMANYRNLFLTLSESYIYASRDPQKAAKVLDRMSSVIPPSVIPMEPGMKYRVASVYSEAGKKDAAKASWREIVDELLPRRDEYLQQQLTQYNPLVVLFYSELELGMFNEAEDLVKVIGAKYAGQPGIETATQQMMAQVSGRRLMSSAAADSTKR